MWNQIYNPLGNTILSTGAAALPVVTLLVLIASNKVKAHIAAVIALIVANLVATVFFRTGLLTVRLAAFPIACFIAGLACLSLVRPNSRAWTVDLSTTSAAALAAAPSASPAIDLTPLALR